MALFDSKGGFLGGPSSIGGSGPTSVDTNLPEIKNKKLGILDALTYNLFRPGSTGGMGGVGMLGDFDSEDFVEKSLRNAQNKNGSGITKLIGGLTRALTGTK